MGTHIKHLGQFLVPSKNAVGVFCHHSAPVTVIIIRSTAATLLKNLAQYLARRMLAICTFVHFLFLLSLNKAPKQSYRFEEGE